MIGLSEAFSDPSVGSGKNLTVANYAISDGNGGDNYVVTKISNATGTITPAPAQLVIANLSSTNITAGGSVTITVNAEDGLGQAVPGYTGTVQLSSSLGGAGLPATYTFLPSDKGAHSFTLALNAAGIQAITVADQANKTLTAATAPITVNTAPLSKFVVSTVGGNSFSAGTAFIVTVQAADAFGNPVSNYAGPTTIPITLTPTDPLAVIPSAVTLHNGFGVFLADLKTKGSYTISATDAADSIMGATPSIAVTAGNAAYFSVAAPTAAVTDTSFPLTVTALDLFGNVATNYTGTVHLTTTDSSEVVGGDLGNIYTFTAGAGQDNGVHVFNVQLFTNGTQKITVADTTATVPAIVGTSSAIATLGLSVTALTNTPTGFTATFNQAINPAELTIYGRGNTQQDVLLVGKNTNNGQPYPGTLIVDASKKLVTFNVSSNFLAAFNSGNSAVLPDDTYTVTLASGVGANGFQDVSGQGIDDGHGGHADFVGRFTTTYQHDNTEVLGIPDFARGLTHPATRPRSSRFPTIRPTAATSAFRLRSTTPPISPAPVLR